MQCIAQKTDTRDDKVLQIVDRVLNQVFGKEATSLIYRHLERNYSLKRNEIAERVEVFAKGLEDFLRSGASVIERKILEDIYSNYGLLRRMELGKVENDCDFVSQMKLFMRKA